MKPRINLILTNGNEVTVELSPEEIVLMRDYVRTSTNGPDRRGVVQRVNDAIKKYVPVGTTLFDVQYNPAEYD